LLPPPQFQKNTTLKIVSWFNSTFSHPGQVNIVGSKLFTYVVADTYKFFDIILIFSKLSLQMGIWQMRGAFL
jgi:hypothetical protein